MSTHREIEAQIAFQLSQLPSKNGHHLFEELCRKLALRRICPNILPATGPVSGGGDRGLDFETFKSFLKQRDDCGGSWFVGQDTAEAVAFACTLEAQERVVEKIRSDVREIKKWGHATKVYMFCGVPIPVPKRNKLKDWARLEAAIDLTIVDCNALAEQLSEPDVFWIAQEYLGVPAELYPRQVGVEWYEKLCEEWRNRDPVGNSHSDYVQIKAAVRHATTDKSAAQDLGGWLARLERLREATSSDALRRLCRYETIVAALRGMGTLVGRDAEVAEYLDRAGASNDFVDLENDVAIVKYCIGALRHNAVAVDFEIVRKAWHAVMAALVEHEKSLNNTYVCLAMELRGAHLLGSKSIQDDLEEGTFLLVWRDMLRRSKDCAMFPIDRFAEVFQQIINIGGMNGVDQSVYDEVVALLDEQVAARSGQLRAAAQSRDRAVAYYDRGDLLRAVDELHEAKERWFTRETMRGAVISSILLGEIYNTLGMRFAGRYYSMVGGVLALRLGKDEDKEYIGQAIGHIVESDYSDGAFFRMIETACALRGPAEVFATEGEGWFEKVVYYSTMARVITSVVDRQMLPALLAKRSELGMDPGFIDLDKTAEVTWADRERTVAATREQGMGIPLGDSGLRRWSRFGALGISWYCCWDNTEEMNAAAEGFLAVLQVILVDCARLDLVIMPCTLVLYVTKGVSEKPRLDEVTSRDCADCLAFRAEVPSQGGDDKICAMAMTLLTWVSLLPEESIKKHVEERMKRRLPSKVLYGGTYAKVYGDLFRGAVFDGGARRREWRPDFSQGAWCHKVLMWKSGPGPGFSVDMAREHARNRYERILERLGATWRKLCADGTWRGVVSDLRRRGWLDWHILLAAFNCALNARLRSAKWDASTVDAMKIRDETSEEIRQNPVAPQEFTLEAMERSLDHSMPATLKSWGLSTRVNRLLLDGVRRVLRERYGYWAVDVPHDDIGV